MLTFVKRRTCDVCLKITVKVGNKKQVLVQIGV